MPSPRPPGTAWGPSGPYRREQVRDWSGRPYALAPMKRLDLAAVAALALGIVLLYFPAEVLGGESTLQGIDYNNIHERRIRYAQEAFDAPGAGLPGWYTRELLGTPFWSN